MPAAPPMPSSRWQLPARVEVTNFSRAGGDWTIDWERAHADARAVLDSIDFSRRDIVIWVPGTDNEGVQGDFARAVEKSWRGDRHNLSLVAMRYEATWRVRRSMPTGLATLKLVFEGIRQRLGETAAGHRITLGGESQGAWIIGELMADPRYERLVTRAVTAGHPWLGAHQYTDGRHPKVRTINHPGDQIAMSVNGDVGDAMDAMTSVRTGEVLQNLDKIVVGILQNPVHGVWLLHHQLLQTPLRPLLSDPHYYAFEFQRMVEYLRSGVFELTEAEREAAGRPKALFT